MEIIDRIKLRVEEELHGEERERILKIIQEATRVQRWLVTHNIVQNYRYAKQTDEAVRDWYHDGDYLCKIVRASDDRAACIEAGPITKPE